MRDCIIFEFILLASAVALVVESASNLSHSVVVVNGADNTGLKRHENRAAALKEAACGLYRDENNEAVWRALNLIGTEPGKGGYSIEDATVAVAGEMFWADRVKFPTLYTNYKHIFKRYFAEPCERVTSVLDNYSGLISDDNEFADDETIKRVKDAGKFCDFVHRKNVAQSLYIEFRRQLRSEQ